MAESPADEGRPRARLVAALAGVALAATGTVAVGAALHGHGHGHDTTPQPPNAGDAKPAASDTRHQPVRSEPAGDLGLPYSRPLRLSIPSIDVATRLEYLELDDDGVMEVPVDPSRAGWFSPSPAPGVPGSSVIAGHVTWDREPAVFFDLGRLRPGDTIKVDRADGPTATFVVQRTGTFAKASFPTRAVYRQIDYPGLRLITCGGRYDVESGTYDSNLIVFARLADHKPADDR
jgi:sortase (surface protein transpeptidase)